jgi:hypothetical protein
MGNGSGVFRGDRNRNGRLERLRALVPLDNAIVGIDLANAKQMIVVTDHDSKVLARKTFRCRGGIWARRWTGLRCRRGLSGSPVSRLRASRPATGGGCWGSWPARGACSSCACSRC